MNCEYVMLEGYIFHLINECVVQMECIAIFHIPFPWTFKPK